MRFLKVNKIDNTKGKRIFIFIISIFLIIGGVLTGTLLGIYLPWAGSLKERNLAATYFNEKITTKKWNYKNQIWKFHKINAENFKVKGADYIIDKLIYELSPIHYIVINSNNSIINFEFSNKNRSNEEKFTQDIISILNKKGFHKQSITNNSFLINNLL